MNRNFFPARPFCQVFLLSSHNHPELRFHPDQFLNPGKYLCKGFAVCHKEALPILGTFLQECFFFYTILKENQDLINTYLMEWVNPINDFPRSKNNALPFDWQFDFCRQRNLSLLKNLPIALRSAHMHFHHYNIVNLRLNPHTDSVFCPQMFL